MIDQKVLDEMVEAAAIAYAKTIGYRVNALAQKDIEGIRAGIIAALCAAGELNVPHKLVSREATEKMHEAWSEETGDQTKSGLEFERSCSQNDWSAMFDAAPGLGE